MEGWVVPLTGVAANGNVTQAYPAWAPAGANPAVATLGQQLRGAIEGICYSLQIATDGTNGGIIQLYDINGAKAGINVSSATAITDAQLLAMIASGDAKLIYVQNFISTPETPINMGVRAFQFGLGLRYVGSGSCTANLVVTGGYRYTTKL